MKYYVIILVFFGFGFPFKTSCQSNFTIKKNNIQWQKAFNDTLKLNRIEKTFKDTQSISFKITDTTLVSGTLKDIYPLQKNSGTSSWKTSFYIQNSTIEANFTIEIKPDRYRVTLMQIKMRAINDITSSGITIMSTNAAQNLSYYATKKGNIRKGFLKNDAPILNQTFTDLFSFKDKQKLQDDW